MIEEKTFPDGYLKTILCEHQESFELFEKTLFIENEKYNLTSITKKEEVLYKHFLDSVAGESFFPKNANVAEVGSGAGFPSVPLKIIRSDLNFSLFESTKKKCDFLQNTANLLQFHGFDVYNLRAEEAGRSEKFREKFEVCCARAVARLNVLSEYCLPLLKIGGRFLAYKGDAKEEIREAMRAIEVLGGKISRLAYFSLPENMGERTIVVIEKIKKTPQEFPRGRGRERKNPIGGTV